MVFLQTGWTSLARCKGSVRFPRLRRRNGASESWRGSSPTRQDSLRAASSNRMADEAVFPVWCYVDRLEQLGEISELEARRWKREIFSVMLQRGLEPEDVVPRPGF